MHGVWVGVVLVALTFTTGFAGKEKLFKKARKEDRVLTLSEQITRYVQYPSFAAQKNIEGVVRLSYVIDENQRLKVLDIQSPNAELREYVRTQIDGQIVASPGSVPTSVKYLKLRFKLY